MEMLRDGKFEQHVIIDDFFKENSIESWNAILTLKIGGKITKKIQIKPEKQIEGFIDSICAHKIIRKLRGKFERSAVAIEPMTSLPKGISDSRVKKLAKKYQIAIPGVGAFHFEERHKSINSSNHP